MNDLTPSELTLIQDAKSWLGYPDDSEIDICDDGSVWIGLTQILPKNSVCDRLGRVS